MDRDVVKGYDTQKRDTDPNAGQANTCEQEQPMVGRRPRTDEEVLSELFSYHAPNFKQAKRYEAIRDAAKYFAQVLSKNAVLGNRDGQKALDLLRQSVMLANASIALEEFLR